MKVTLIQSDLRWNDPQANRDHLEQKMAVAEAADLFVLPEMFSTGFCTNPSGVAEPAEGDTFGWMQRMARQHDAAICGSVATQDQGKFYNRFYFVFPDGSYRSYDKHHLFTYGGEHKQYTAGQERVIVEFRGWRILVLVCYDLRFPVWSRNRGDYDLMLYVASWPTSRVEAWSALLRARAIENLCYVAGVNRVGDDPNCNYCGGTVLLDYFGQPIVEGIMGSEGVLCGEIDAVALEAYRSKFPALNDADAFVLK
ncbi:MAG: amidohydrolase [Alistipes sp.]|nr:amidohydrolase [Alistipes sp.]